MLGHQRKKLPESLRHWEEGGLRSGQGRLTPCSGKRVVCASSTALVRIAEQVQTSSQLPSTPTGPHSQLQVSTWPRPSQSECGTELTMGPGEWAVLEQRG